MALGVLTQRQVILWIVFLLSCVAALSAPVGFVAATGHTTFNWDVASIFGTALGTTALAGFTGALAFTTSGDVRATWELARLTQRDQEARERPVVVVHRAEVALKSWELSSEGGKSGVLKAHVAIDLRNVGLGPALRVAVEASHIETEYGPEVATATIAAISPDETATLRLEVPFASPPQDGEIRSDGVILHGTFLDRSLRNVSEIITDWEGVPPDRLARP
jgi:hypothetical protein